MSTQAKILNLLNRQPYTVIELANALEITRNSAHLQIAKLEASGLIQKMDRRRVESAGKPAFEYQIVEGSEDTFSDAYKPLVGSIVEVLEQEMSLEGRKKIFHKAGVEMAIKAGLTGSGDAKSNLDRAVAVLNSLGAMAEVEETGDHLTLSSFSCPVAASVRADTQTCNLVAAFLGKATSSRVVSKCKKEGNLICQFAIHCST